MFDRLELFTDEEIRAARNITLRTPDYGWSQQVTGHRTSSQQSGATMKPPLVAVIELHEFDAGARTNSAAPPGCTAEFGVRAVMSAVMV